MSSAISSRRRCARGAAFARPQLALGLARSVLELAALGVLVARDRGRRRDAPSRPRLRRRRSAAARLIANPEVAGATAAAGLAGGMTLLGLPLSAVARRRAIAVGLVTQPWRGWAADLVKQLAIETVLAGGAGAAITALTRRYPRNWWLPAAAGSVALGTLLGALAPVLLDPVFNDFAPLPRG